MNNADSTRIRAGWDLSSQARRAIQGDGGASGGREEIYPLTEMPAAPAYTLDELDLDVFDPGPDADRGDLGRKELSRLSITELVVRQSEERGKLLEQAKSDALTPDKFSNSLLVAAELLQRNKRYGSVREKRGPVGEAAETCLIYQKLAQEKRWEELARLETVLESAIIDILIGCAAELQNMTPAQISHLTDMPILFVKAALADRFIFSR